MEKKPAAQEKPYIQNISELLHFDKFADRLKLNKEYGSVLFISIVTILVLIMCDVFRWYYNINIFISDSTILIGIIFTVFATIFLYIAYYKTLDYLVKRNFIGPGIRNELNSILPRWVKPGLLVLAMLSFLASNIVAWLADNKNPEYINSIRFVLAWRLTQPIYQIFVVGVIVADMFYISLGIFRLPFRIKKDITHIDILDPERCGGIKPVGKLSVYVATVYFIGLLMFMVFLIYINLFKDIGIKLLFVGGIILGFILFIIPQLGIHAFMKKEKEKYLEGLVEQINESEKQNPITTEEDIKKLKADIKILQLYLKYERGQKMEEYPINSEILKEVIFAALIPIAVELAYELLHILKP
jgi:hypothetical protein